MIVRLHNLSVQSPEVSHCKAVAALITAGRGAGARPAHENVEEEIKATWHRQDFNLKIDAWTVTTKQGDIVGYADVCYAEDGCLRFTLHVHTDYRGRGIGTLLLWLVEERARRMGKDIAAEKRVVLNIEVRHSDKAAARLLERDGYKQVRHFWRLLIEMDEAAVQSYDEHCHCGKIKMDLVVDAQNLEETTSLDQRTGIYMIQQYNVYEKELRAPTDRSIELLNVPYASA